jgi:hypothetical protein
MANKVFRFALGSAAEPRSGLWRAWTHEDEVHLGVRSTHAEVHLIAYPTGRWRITIGSDVSKWTRPPEFRPGWTRGPDLLIPHSPARVRLPAVEPETPVPTTWLAPPQPGFVARFSLLLASPRAEGSTWRPQDAPGTVSLAVLPLRTAGALHLNRLDEPLNPEEWPAVTTGDPAAFEVVVSADHTGRPTLRVSPIP